MVQAGEVKIILNSLSGGYAELMLPEDVTVHQLKSEISQLWHFPDEFQMLLVECEPLDESCSLLDYTNDGALSVLVLISPESINKALDSLRKQCTPASEQIATLTTLARLGQNIRLDCVIDSAEDLLDSDDSSVQDAALACITQLRENGNTIPLEAFAACFAREELREAAIASLRQMKGDAHALNCMSELLDHNDTLVCLAALDGLEMFATHGHKGALARVSECLTDDDEVVRYKAFTVLVNVAMKGESHLFAPVAEAIKPLHLHPMKEVRWYAGEVFLRLTDHCSGE